MATVPRAWLTEVLGWVDAHTNRKVPDPRSMRVMSWTQSAEALLEQLMA